MGMSAAFSYYQFQNSKPLKTISHLKPSGTIFEIYWLISVIGQAALHLYGTERSVEIGKRYSTEEDLKTTHDEEFKPAFLNTSVFLFSFLSQTIIFLFNHSGEPHVQGLQSNKTYLKFMVACVAFCFVFAVNYFPDFSDSLELTFKGVPEDANDELLRLFTFVTASSYALEMSIRYLKYKKLFGYI